MCSTLAMDAGKGDFCDTRVSIAVMCENSHKDANFTEAAVNDAVKSQSSITGDKEHCRQATLDMTWRFPGQGGNFKSSVVHSASIAGPYDIPAAMASRAFVSPSTFLAPKWPPHDAAQAPPHKFEGQLSTTPSKVATTHDLEEILTEDQRPESEAALLSLPGELRNKIYESLDLSDGVICLHCPAARDRAEHERLHKSAITRVCRRLRSEVTCMYYSTNRFDMTCIWTTSSCPALHGGSGLMDHRWLTSVEPFGSLIQDVKFRLPGWNTWTRFKLKPSNSNPHRWALVVTTGEPVSAMRTTLLQLLLHSYFFDATRMVVDWMTEDLYQVLLDVPRVVEEIEAKARLSVELIRWMPEGAKAKWDIRHEGIVQVYHDDWASHQAYGVLEPPTVPWQELTTDLASVIGKSDRRGALLVDKEAAKLAMEAVLQQPHHFQWNCCPEVRKLLMTAWANGF